MKRRLLRAVGIENGCVPYARHGVRALSQERHASHTSGSHAFAVGDIVLLKPTENPDSSPILTKPLRRDARIQSHRGDLGHNDIIGRRVRDTVCTTSGKELRIHVPTLAEYVTLTPRLVTPVYAGEANLIVSLLDIHAAPPSSREDLPSLELLEAGTGHGSLTLHLARAIHAANATSLTRTDAAWEEAQPQRRGIDDERPLDQATSNTLRREPRAAVLHSLDISPKHSQHAKKIVQGFRHGLYADNVEFHVGSIPEFIHNQTLARGSRHSFLNYIILDLPGPQGYMKALSDILHVDGTLAVFCPSITQIVKCVDTQKSAGLPLWLEQVVELGANISAGKQWDVRAVRPRSLTATSVRESKDATATSQHSTPLEGSASNLYGRVSDSMAEAAGLKGIAGPPPDTTHMGWETICKPKLGDRITAGGFLGLWKRTRK